MMPIFVVGNNKTGTTSVAAWARHSGIPVDAQRPFVNIFVRHSVGELDVSMFHKELAARIKEGFLYQDLPFSWPGVWEFLVMTFPNAQYLYSQRSGEQWYSSLIRHHARRVGFNLDRSSAQMGMPTRALDLLGTQEFHGFPFLDVVSSLYKTPKDDPYHRDSLLAYHADHEELASQLFR